MSSPKQRHALTDAQRKALRFHYNSHPSPRLTHKELQDWFSNRYGRTLSQAVISRVLSEKYAFLDTPQTLTEEAGIRRRHRVSKWPELEDALYEWQKQMISQGTNVNGESLRQQAEYLWHTLPTYQGQTMPSFSPGWLDKFKKRHNLHTRRNQTRARLAAAATASPGPAQMPAQRDLLPPPEEAIDMQYQFGLEDIFSMQERGLYLKLMPDHTWTIEPVRPR